MKIRKKLILTCFVNMLITHTFAYTNNKNLINEKPLYCPDQVICSEKGNLASCQYESNVPDLWGSLAYTSNMEDKGFYKLHEVESGYHTDNAKYIETICTYSLNGNHASNTRLILKARAESNLEAYIDNLTHWKSSDNIKYTCDEAASLSCPLTPIDGFGVKLIGEKDDEIHLVDNYGDIITYGILKSDDYAVIKRRSVYHAPLPLP